MKSESENKKNQVLDLWCEKYDYCNVILVRCNGFKNFKSSIKLMACYDTGYREEVVEDEIIDEVFINYFSLEIHKIIEDYVEENDEELSYVKDLECSIMREYDGFEIFLTIDTPDGEDELQVLI
ncbi:MAG: hypothetical protein KJS45_08360 [Bacteroidetes bacterium]|nr:hypothetical protein [Bacteroidota bacterium]